MTTVCHKLKKFKKKLNIVVNIYFIWYNFDMKKSFILIFLLCLITLLSFNTSNLVLAFAENIEKVDITVENISKYNYIDKHADNFVLTSTELNTITIANSTDTKSFSTLGGTEGSVSNPYFTKAIDEQNLAVIDEFDRIQIFNYEFQFIKQFYAIQTSSSFIKLGKVVSIDVDYSGVLYMLDLSNNKILKLDISETYISEVMHDVSDFEVTEDSQIAVNTNGNLIAICGASEKTFILNTQTNLVTEITCQNAIKLFFDCSNNLYAVKADGTIEKYLSGTFQIDSSKTISNSFSDITIDVETGTIYFINDDIFMIDTAGWTANASLQSAPIDITSTQLHQNALMVCEAKSDTKLFATSVSFSSSVNIAEGTKLVVLDYQTAQNTNLSYVLAVINNAETFGYVDNTAIEQINLSSENTQYKTICKNVKVLSYPTQNAGTSKLLAENQKVTIIGNCGNFIDEVGNTYFEVNIDGKIGYVNQNYLVKTDLFESKKTSTTAIDTHKGQFVAFMLAVASLGIVTLFVCVVILKKAKFED